LTNREFFMNRSASEFPAFVNVIKALPEKDLSWRPHERSRSAEELVGHLIGHEQDLVELVTTGKINHRNQVPFKDRSDAVELLKAAHAQLEQALTKIDDKSWDSTKGSFAVNGKVFYEMPYRDLAWMLFFDSLHHRGQLSTYLRPMGGKVPSIYGPSADDAGGH
jgi:uncharacterized damage-inducible protein DinB